MRRLDEWHKYVDLQARRASAAKVAPSTAVSTVAEEAAEPAVDERDIYSEPLHADPYLDAGRYVEAEGSAAVATLPEEPEPAYMRPTPLPAQIEFAPAETPVPASRHAEISRYELDEREDDVAREGFDGDRRPTRMGNRPIPPARIARAGRPAARKETREELLARLLDPELTLEEAAQVLNVCPTTVRRYTNRGILPHFRTMGNQRRFRLSQVLAFLESQEGQPHPMPSRMSTSQEESLCDQQVLTEQESPTQP